jgi:Polysaccharide lyase/Ca-dependent carbohydrate-binding module xylan-binding
MFPSSGIRANRARIRSVFVLASTTAALAAMPGLAQADASVQGESLTLAPAKSGVIVSDSAAEGHKALKLLSNGSASRSVASTTGLDRISVRARGQSCAGAPKLTVDVDGVRRLTATVSATKYAAYSASAALPTGTHAVKVAFVNDSRSATCDRNVFVDAIALRSGPEPAVPAPATPAPAPAPAPAPVPPPPPAPGPDTSPAPAGRLLQVADFETNDFSQWSSVQAFSRERYSTVTSPVRQGRYAGKFVSIQGECGSTDDCKSVKGRTEAVLSRAQHDIHEGDDRWYRWYSYFPNDPGPIPGFTFTQWRANGEGAETYARNGIYGLMDAGPNPSGPGGYIRFQRNGTRWSAPLERGTWYKFLLHVKYSNDPTIGKYEMWVNDKPAMSFNDYSKPPVEGVYMKQGIYRLGGTPSGTVYHDGLRVATTRALADTD